MIRHLTSADPINLAEVRTAAVNAKKGPKSCVAPFSCLDGNVDEKLNVRHLLHYAGA